MSVVIKLIDQSEHKHTTVGTWTLDPQTGDIVILVSKMSDWRFEQAVIGHERKEVFWCKANGITQAECDAWDDQYEKLYKSGAVPPSYEPGEDPNCPYHRGHMLGIIEEIATIIDTGANWRDYNNECDELMGIGGKPSTTPD
jgi:hypothetical protein